MEEIINNTMNQEELESILNKPQLMAMKHSEGPLLVLAGAGTGKTRVLIYRIAHIISEQKAYPSQILAVTFTNKASLEMQERIREIIPSDGLNIGTFHSIAARMLRSHSDLLNINITSTFTIIDQDDQVKLIKNILTEQNIDIKEHKPKVIHSIISRWKDQNLLPEKISNSDNKSHIHSIAIHAYPIYQKRMHESNVVDFGDILLYANYLLIKNPEILKYYQNKYKYILIDEYQDTNAAQYVWVRMLATAHQNICCVGDDDQSIYSWRGAEVQNILRFEKDFPEAKVITLEQNYRSTSHILNAASGVINHNKNRHSKKLWTDSIEGEKINIISCWNDKEEARFVYTEIDKLIKDGDYNSGQIAVLVRAGFQTRAFEEIFISNALPYQIIGGLRFYERMEVRDLLAYVRLSINNNDNLALERIINVPRRSIGNVTLKKIKDYAIENELSVFTSIKQMISSDHFKGASKVNLEKFIHLIEDAGAKYAVESSFNVSKYLLEESGYLGLLKAEKTEESRSRIENLNEMLKAIDEFDDIYEFIEHSSLVMDNESLENNFGGVTKIMTMHASKGLEFDIVFLPGWEENIFPHQKALSEEGEKGLEEERRLAYVGITRSKKLLYISHAETRRIFAEFVNSIPSRFLSEIPEELCQKTNSSRKLNYTGSRHNFSMQNAYKKSPTNAVSNVRSGSGNQPGSRVTHQKFGTGIVIRKNGFSLEIAFDKSGIKTIKEDFVEKV